MYKKFAKFIVKAVSKVVKKLEYLLETFLVEVCLALKGLCHELERHKPSASGPLSLPNKMCVLSRERSP
jgi:hypothetical protein